MLTASYAKINLFLEVIGKLPDNYHQVNTVLCSIDLCDYITYQTNCSGNITISSSDSSLANTDNLLFKVAQFLNHKYGISLGVHIYLEKHIPIAAGLGGGSSNAASCITSLNELWHLGLDRTEMHNIASQFGSDINFFLEGGCALGENRGEQITKLPDLPISNILLVNPHIHIASSTAYKLVQIPSQKDRREFNQEDLCKHCFNRLEQGIRKKYPVINEIIMSLNSFGAKVAMMSGSGSTCFGIFPNENTLALCEDHFANRGYWTKHVHTLPAIDTL